MTISLPILPENPEIPEPPDGCVPLSRTYVAVGGAPVLHSVAPRIFTLGYFQPCMECTFCEDQCCSYGVGVGVENAARLRSIAEHLAPRTIGRPEEWFEEEITDEPDYPELRALDTQVIGKGCAFLRKDGRGCAIHAHCIERGIDYHEYKPMYCSLFPLTCDEGYLLPSIEVDERSLVCVGDRSTIYRGVRGELLFYFGAELVAELDALERETLAAAK